MSHAPRQQPPLMGFFALWTVRVLAWVGLLVSAYLAWRTVGQLPIAGCAGTGLFDCNAVHNSQWSMWFSLPVALAGLACYAALAAVSSVPSWHDLPARRWINTALVMLSTVAGGAALWFIALQAVAIGSVCLACMVVHVCGITIASLVLWAVRRQSSTLRPTRATPGLATLFTALPVAAKPQQPTRPALDVSPRIGLALGGAMAVIALLIGGQVLFPAQTFNVQTVELDEPINIGGSIENRQMAPLASSEMSAQPHVAMRISEEPADRAAGDDAAASDGSSGELTAGNAPDERVIQLLRGKLTLDVYDQPVLGSPEAPHVLVELVSYDCPHCRKTHETMKQGRERYGDQLAVVVMPVPLEKSCNPFVTHFNPEHHGSCALARYALAVAATEPDAFEEFHEWLMTGEKAPPVEEVIKKAYDTVSRDRLRGVVYGDKVKSKIKENVDLFATLQKQHSANRNFGLPVQIMNNGVMSGAAADAESVFRTWEEHLGMEAPE